MTTATYTRQREMGTGQVDRWAEVTDLVTENRAGAQADEQDEGGSRLDSPCWRGWDMSRMEGC